MTRYLLDTNIISNVTRPEPSIELLHWWRRQNEADLHVSALTIGEIGKGIEDLPAGKRREALRAWFSGPLGPQALFAGRILAFDEAAAVIWASLMAQGRASGRPRNGLDMIIAATAVAQGCMVVTDNARDFIGLPHINPMRPE